MTSIDLRKLKAQKNLDQEVIKRHEANYRLAKTKLDEQITNIRMIKKVTEYLLENRVVCYKYNYSLDEGV
jgi:hypothetical protein